MRDSSKAQRDQLGETNRELEAMSDWELERGLASSTGFDQDRRVVANRILRKRYVGPERGVVFWILVFAAGACLLALME